MQSIVCGEKSSSFPSSFMSFLRLCPLWFAVVITWIICPCLAESEPARLGEAGKCGRDCIYYVCHRFGQQESLDEVDQQLDYQVDINFTDMRKALESRGLFCKTLMFNARNVGRLQNTLNKHADSLYAIAALPTSTDTEHHFAIITQCSDSLLTVFDVSNNRTVRINTSNYKGKPITVPILLVGKEPILYKTFSGFDVLFGLAVLVIFFGLGDYLITKGWGKLFWLWLHLSVRYCYCLLTFRQSAIIGGTTIVVILLWLVYQEYRYNEHPLELVNRIVDLGEIELFSKNDVVIEVRNRSFRTVSIEEVQISCSCLTIEEYPEIIEPKSVRKVKLQLVPLLEGNVSYQALIVPQSFAPIVGGISYSGYQQVRMLPKYLNIGLVEMGELNTFSCKYIVEDLREEFLAIETITMHGEEPIFEVIGDLPQELRNREAFAITIKYLGNAPMGSFLQSFEIRGKGNSGNEIVLLSNILGLVVE